LLLVFTNNNSISPIQDLFILGRFPDQGICLLVHVHARMAFRHSTLELLPGDNILVTLR
jgi:hypothetical protein